MKKLLMLVLFLSVQSVFAQAPGAPQDPNNPPPDWLQRLNANRDYWNKINGNNQNGTIKQPVKEVPPQVLAERRKRQKEAEAEKKRFLDEMNQKLAAPTIYRQQYTDFLKEKNTGITRIFPDKGCDKGLTVSVEDLERCGATPQIAGAGSLYSVRLNAIPSNLPLDIILDYIAMSDMHFVGDRLLVGNSLTQDIISDVGDIPLPDVNLKSDAFRFLIEYKPPKTASKFAEEIKMFETGVESNGFSYSNSAVVKLNSTYVLRSTAFALGRGNFWNTDVLMAFKIVGQETDGSIIFVWKMLREKDAPVLKIK